MKYTNLTLALGAVSVVLVGLASCSGGKSDADDTVMAFRTITGRATYTLENTSKIYNTDHDIAYFDSAALVMPTVICNRDITPLQDSIIKAAFDTVAVDHGDAMKSFFERTANESGFTAVAAADSALRSDVDGMTIVTGDIFNMSGDLLTYRVSKYQYSPGAAHGMTISKYITYVIEDGRIVSLSDIFTPEGLRELPGMIRARAEELAPSLGRTDITALPSMGNFYISLDDNIVFVFQPYEVASYAQGAIAVPFYPYQLSGQMTDYGLKIFGLGE